MQLRSRAKLSQSGDITAPSSPAWVRAAKQFDFYPKNDDSAVQKRSQWGGATTLICAIVVVYLVSGAMIDYVRPQTMDTLTVDTRRGKKLPINVDIYFPSLSCLDIAVDAVESSSGETLVDATHQIFKERVDQNELGNEIKSAGTDCLPCLPPNPPRAISRFKREADAACCLQCADVRDYLQRHNLPQYIADQTPQCKVTQPFSDKEGCRVRGYLTVPRGKGDFHIAAGAGFSQKHDEHQHHIHQVDWSRLDKFNITHTVKSISFGPSIPNVENPLDNHTVFASTLAQHIYLIQVIPTTYETGGELLLSNQYSFTQHHQRVHKYVV